jgi:hypothetical protein
MRPPVAAIMQERMTIGVILASNFTPPAVAVANPPAGIFTNNKVNSKGKYYLLSKEKKNEREDSRRGGD